MKGATSSMEPVRRPIATLQYTGVMSTSILKGSAREVLARWRAVTPGFAPHTPTTTSEWDHQAPRRAGTSHDGDLGNCESDFDPWSDRPTFHPSGGCRRLPAPRSRGSVGMGDLPDIRRLARPAGPRRRRNASTNGHCRHVWTSGCGKRLATPDDIANMAVIAEEAMRAGALGFSTNRLPSHTAKDGRPVPGTFADDDELLAIARAMARGGGGVVEVVSAESMGVVDGGYRRDIDWGTALSVETGLPITLPDADRQSPNRWRDVLKWIDEVSHKSQFTIQTAAGRSASSSASPPSIISVAVNHSTKSRTFRLPQLVAALRDPERKARILSERAAVGIAPVDSPGRQAWALDDPPNYEPDVADSVGAIALGRGVRPTRSTNDLYCVTTAALVLFTIGGYGNRQTRPHRRGCVLRQLDPRLADGGAHVSLICERRHRRRCCVLRARSTNSAPASLSRPLYAKMTSAPPSSTACTSRHRRRGQKPTSRHRLRPARVQMPEVVADSRLGAKRIIQRAMATSRRSSPAR